MKTACVDALIAQAQDDWLSYAEVLQILEEHGDANRLDEDIEFIIKSRMFVVGDVSAAEGFVPWSLSAEEAIIELNRRKAGLSRYYPGDVCWFALPWTEEANDVVA